MKKLSILNNFKRENYFKEPFPHIIIKDCLPPEIIGLLNDDFPDQDEFLKYDRHHNVFKENFRYNISANTIFNESQFQKKISKTTYNFFKYHTSSNFFYELFEIFGNDIKNLYPLFYEKIKKYNTESDIFSYRNPSSNIKKKITLDCQFAINSINQVKSSVVSPHIDNPYELFAGLLYMKDSRDKSKCSNLEILEWNNNEKVHFYGKNRVDYKNLKKTKEVQYEFNTLILFLNSPNSFHTVTPREPNNIPRKFFNIIIETNFFQSEPLFNINKKISTRLIEKFFSNQNKF